MSVAPDPQVMRDPFDALSERERQVVALVATGLTAREIGERLFISQRTVETHCSKAKHKLGLLRRGELIVYAVRRSLSRDLGAPIESDPERSQEWGHPPRTTL